MIFRDHSGKLIEINKLNFTNDKLYYSKILQIKKSNLLQIETRNNTKLNYHNNTSINNLINFT